MMRTKAALISLIALSSLSGCVSFEVSRLGREVAHDLEQARDARVRGGFAFAAGRGTIGASRFLGRLVAPKSTAEVRRMVRYMRRAKVAMFAVDGITDVAGVARPAALDRYQENDGWYPLVTARDSSGAAWILYREDGDALRDLLTVVVSPEAIVVTKLSGDLSELVLDAIDTWTPSTLFDDMLSPDDPLEEGDPGGESQGDAESR